MVGDRGPRGEGYAVAPEDVEVRGDAAPASASRRRPAIVAVTTRVGPGAHPEGYARELVRRIQQLRKDAGLEISDRIVTYVADSDLMHGYWPAGGARRDVERRPGYSCIGPGRRRAGVQVTFGLDG